MTVGRPGRKAATIVVAACLLACVQGCLSSCIEPTPDEAEVRSFLGEFLPKSCLIEGKAENLDVPSVMFRYRETGPDAGSAEVARERFVALAQGAGWRLIQGGVGPWVLELVEPAKALGEGWTSIEQIRITTSKDGWCYVGYAAEKLPPKDSAEWAGDAGFGKGYWWPKFERYIQSG
jgi:hypothetical protein